MLQVVLSGMEAELWQEIQIRLVSAVDGGAGERLWGVSISGQGGRGGYFCVGDTQLSRVFGLKGEVLARLESLSISQEL